MIKIRSIRHLYPERVGFRIHRKNGLPFYTFLHLLNPIEITLNGETFRTFPHACIVFAPNEPQLWSSLEENVVHDWMHFENVPEDLFRSLGIETGKVFYPTYPDFIPRIIREMENEFYQSFSHQEELLDLKFKELFIKISRAVHGESTLPVDKALSDSVRRLRGDMLLRLNEEWTVKRMATAVGTSESKFYLVYKTLFGISPTNDLIHAKVNVAKNALLFQKTKIAELAESLGYNNVTHFIRQFKQFVGLSPSEYRKRKNL